MASYNSKDNSELFDVVSTLKLYASKWYFFVISVIICCGLAFLYTRVKHDIYLVKANVIIKSEETTPSMASAISAFSGGLLGGNADVEDEIFVVSSHSVLRDVVKDMKLNKLHVDKRLIFLNEFRYLDYAIDVTPVNPNIADTLRRTLIFKVHVSDDGDVSVKVKARHRTIGRAEGSKLPLKVNTTYGDFIISKTPNFIPGESLTTNIIFSGYDAMAENIAEDLAIDIASKHSNVVALSVETADTDYGRDLLNAIIKKYNDRGIYENSVKGMRTTDFIDTRLNLLAEELQSSETDIEKFKKEHNMVDLVAETTYQMTKKGELEKDLIYAMTQQEILKMTRDFITDPANNYSIIPGFNGSEPLATALDSYNKLILQRINLQQTAKGDNQQLRAINAQIDAMRSSINESLRKEYENGEVKLQEFRSQVNNTDSRLGYMPSFEKVFRDMTRQQVVKEQIYVFLLKHREETAMMMANSLEKGHVVDEAYALNKPVGLSTIAILLLAFVFGLLIPPVWFYIKKVTRTKFSSKEEVESMTRIPVLGEVCEDKSGDTIVINENSTGSSAELFRLIRSNLQFVLDNDNDKVVLLTSTQSGEGKSYVAINLAASLALMDKKVLLVGMDIRNPKLSEYLGLSSQHGLTQYLASQQISLDDIILHDKEGNFDVILSGPIPPNPSELLLSKKLDSMMAALRDRYDVIIIDSAPIGMVSDTFSLVRLTDATVYICRANYTPIRDISYINDLYEEERLKKMSIIVNGTSTKKSYGYGYGQRGSH